MKKLLFAMTVMAMAITCNSEVAMASENETVVEETTVIETASETVVETVSEVVETPAEEPASESAEVSVEQVQAPTSTTGADSFGFGFSESFATVGGTIVEEVVEEIIPEPTPEPVVPTEPEVVEPTPEPVVPIEPEVEPVVEPEYIPEEVIPEPVVEETPVEETEEIAPVLVEVEEEPAPVAEELVNPAVRVNTKPLPPKTKEVEADNSFPFWLFMGLYLLAAGLIIALLLRPHEVILIKKGSDDEEVKTYKFFFLKNACKFIQEFDFEENSEVRRLNLSYLFKKDALDLIYACDAQHNPTLRWRFNATDRQMDIVTDVLGYVYPVAAVAKTEAAKVANAA